MEFTITEKIGERLDSTISDISQISRTKIQKYIKDGCVSIDGKVITDGSKKITSPSCIVTIDQKNFNLDDEAIRPIAEDIPLDIVYEDDDLMVINKASGMVCHPAPGHHTGTLVNAIMWHCKDKLSDVGEDISRPGIVHRLDKDTSGLMVVAKSNIAHQKLSEYFASSKGKNIIRKYLCFCFGIPAVRNSVVETFIGRDPKNRQQYTVTQTIGKNSITMYEMLKTAYITSTKPLSLIECELLTGRTHQIRVHMKHIGCPLVGDPMYGKRKVEYTYPEVVKDFHRTALHSHYLEFLHPVSKETLCFEADLPGDLKTLDELF